MYDINNRPPKWDDHRPQYLSLGLAIGLFLSIAFLNMSFQRPVFVAADSDGGIEPSLSVPASIWPKKKVVVPPAQEEAKQKLAPVVEIKTVKDDIEAVEAVEPELFLSEEVFIPTEVAPAPKVVELITPKEKPIETVIRAERMPVFGDCLAETEEERRKCSESALLKYIYSKLRYPTIARENRLEGMVVVEFVINSDGQVIKVKVLRGIGGGCGKSVTDVIATLPDWLPGKQNGRPVNVIYRMPVKFHLE